MTTTGETIEGTLRGWLTAAAAQRLHVRFHFDVKGGDHVDGFVEACFTDHVTLAAVGQVAHVRAIVLAHVRMVEVIPT